MCQACLRAPHRQAENPAGLIAAIRSPTEARRGCRNRKFTSELPSPSTQMHPIENTAIVRAPRESLASLGLQGLERALDSSRFSVENCENAITRRAVAFAYADQAGQSGEGEGKLHCSTLK